MKKYLSLFFLIVLASCSSTSATTKQISSTSEITPSSTTTFIQTIAPTKTITPIPTSSAYCDPVEANKAIKKLLEITDIHIEENSEVTPTLTPTSEPTSDQKISETDQLLIIGAFKEQQLELSIMSVPKCLLSAKKHAINSFDGFIQLMSRDENDNNIDVYSILVYISDEQQSFKDEIEKVQACLPIGCIPSTEQP